jgi:hypothetical protein
MIPTWLQVILGIFAAIMIFYLAALFIVANMFSNVAKAVVNNPNNTVTTTPSAQPMHPSTTPI